MALRCLSHVEHNRRLEAVLDGTDAEGMPGRGLDRRPWRSRFAPPDRGFELVLVDAVDPHVSVDPLVDLAAIYELVQPVDQKVFTIGRGQRHVLFWSARRSIGI